MKHKKFLLELFEKNLLRCDEQGNVFKNGKILKAKLMKLGYRIIMIRFFEYSFKKEILEHQLVFLYFNRSLQYEKMHINHINGNRADNRLANLELVTPKENSAHAIRTGLRKKTNKGLFVGSKNPSAILTEEQVLKIRSLYPDKTQKEIAVLFNINQTSISDIVLRKSWTHI